MRVIILKDYNLISNWVSNYIHSKISNAQDKFVLGVAWKNALGIS